MSFESASPESLPESVSETQVIYLIRKNSILMPSSKNLMNV